MAALLGQRTRQCSSVMFIAGVVVLKLTVIPKRFEIRNGRFKKSGVTGLSEFHGPFNATDQRRFRQVGAADKRRSEIGESMENPRFCVQSSATTIERNSHFNAG